MPRIKQLGVKIRNQWKPERITPTATSLRVITRFVSPKTEIFELVTEVVVKTRIELDRSAKRRGSKDAHYVIDRKKN